MNERNEVYHYEEWGEMNVFPSLVYVQLNAELLIIGGIDYLSLDNVNCYMIKYGVIHWKQKKHINWMQNTNHILNINIFIHKQTKIKNVLWI